MIFNFRLRLAYTLALLVFSLPSWSQQDAADYKTVMQQVIARGDSIVTAYVPEERVKYGNAFSDLYFGGFEGEGLEFAVGQADQQAMIEIELGFSRLINAAVSGQPKSDVEIQWRDLKAKLNVAPMIESATSSYWELVVQSLLILLREGVEALLVLAALLAYMRKAGAADRTLYVWMGAGAAFIASVLTAWGLQTLIQNSGATREVIEGVTMIIAALLLSYVSFWLFSRREMQHWQNFVHDKLGSAIDNRNLLAIVSVAFFAVYREGAETILFYQALISGAGFQWEPIIVGFAIACTLLLLVYVLIFMLSVKLPLKLFFTATAILLFSLSVIFAGKSVLELQVSGWLPSTAINGIPTVGWLGLFPSLESVGLQLTFLIAPLIVYVLYRRVGHINAQT